MSNSYKIVIEKSVKWEPPDRFKRWCDDNINTDLAETVCEDVDLIPVFQDMAQWWAFVKSVMNIRIS